jgi:hypothetical protein
VFKIDASKRLSTPGASRSRSEGPPLPGQRAQPEDHLFTNSELQRQLFHGEPAFDRPRAASVYAQIPEQSVLRSNAAPFVSAQHEEADAGHLNSLTRERLTARIPTVDQR